MQKETLRDYIMPFVDTHCHLYLEEFNADRSETLQRAKNNGIEKLVIPNVDCSTLEGLMACVSIDKKVCFPAIGIHPCSIKDNYKDELKQLEAAVKVYKPVAIGEIGLDLYWDKTFFAQQQDAFEIQILWAEALNLPVIIHTRDAFDATFEIVARHKNLRGVFHAFSGNAEQARMVIDRGFYLGIGGVVTFKNGGLDKIIPEIPLASLVLETDAPYLTPAPHRGKRNEPSYIQLIAEKLASIYQVPVSEIEAATWKNSHDLFSI